MSIDVLEQLEKLSRLVSLGDKNSIKSVYALIDLEKAISQEEALKTWCHRLQPELVSSISDLSLVDLTETSFTFLYKGKIPGAVTIDLSRNSMEPKPLGEYLKILKESINNNTIEPLIACYILNELSHLDNTNLGQIGLKISLNGLKYLSKESERIIKEHLKIDGRWTLPKENSRGVLSEIRELCKNYNNRIQLLEERDDLDCLENESAIMVNRLLDFFKYLESKIEIPSIEDIPIETLLDGVRSSNTKEMIFELNNIDLDDCSTEAELLAECAKNPFLSTLVDMKVGTDKTLVVNGPSSLISEYIKPLHSSNYINLK